MNVYVVRADYGYYAEHFVKGEYVAIGWLPKDDLSTVTNRADLTVLYKAEYPSDTSNVVIGQQVGQIARFIFDIQVGDYVITPSEDTNYIYYGIVQGNYYKGTAADGCNFLQRRKVKWEPKPILRSQFSVPFQNSIRATLTVFKVDHLRNFLETIGRSDLIPAHELRQENDYYTTILNHILKLHDKEFEILVQNILNAMGFEGAEHTGRVGDGGVDVKGELNISNMAKIKLFVQAKRFKLGSKIAANVVKALRQNIPSDAQGAFFATCEYQDAAKQIALEPGFPRIGLINGNQLVDLLEKHWDAIDPELQTKIGLSKGLVTK